VLYVVLVSGGSNLENLAALTPTPIVWGSQFPVESIGVDDEIF